MQAGQKLVTTLAERAHLVAMMGEEASCLMLGIVAQDQRKIDHRATVPSRDADANMPESENATAVAAAVWYCKALGEYCWNEMIGSGHWRANAM